ncbi:MAG: hypothetical protein R3Y21_04615 [Mycoplasmatota bacterium]
MTDKEYLRIRVYYKYNNLLIKRIPDFIYSYLLSKPELEPIYLSADINIENLLNYISKETLKDNSLEQSIIKFIEGE